jgi:sugar phosphate permease
MASNAGEQKQTDRKYRGHRIRAFAILWFVYGGYYLCRNCYFVAKPAIGAKLAMSNSQLGLIDLAFLSMYALGQFINGPLGDRHNPKLIIGFGMILSVAMAFSFGLSSGLIMFMIFWGITGYAQSTGWTSCVKSMDNWFSSRERGAVMGFWSTCYQTIGFVARILAAAAIGWFGWRYSFFIPATLMLAIALVFIFFHVNSPKDAGLPPVEQYFGGKGNAAGAADGCSPNGLREKASEAMLRILKSKTVWTVGLAFLCITFVRYALMSWLAKYLYDVMKFSAASAGYQSAVPELAGLFGTIFAGCVSDRYLGSRRGPIATVMLVGLAAACALQWVFAAHGEWWNLAGLCLIYFMLNGPISIMVGAAAMDFGRGGGTATAVGLINGMGAIGAAIQGPLIGWVSDKYGWGFLFYLFICMSLIAAFLMASLWNNKSAKAQLKSVG